MKGIIPNYANSDTPSCRQGSLEAANTFNKNSLSNSSTSVYCLLLGTQKGESTAKCPATVYSLVWVGIKKKKEDTFSKRFTNQSSMMPSECARQRVCQTFQETASWRVAETLFKGNETVWVLRDGWVGGHSGWRVWNKLYYPRR